MQFTHSLQIKRFYARTIRNNPTRCGVANAYDMVINGYEVGGGSVPVF